MNANKPPMPLCSLVEAERQRAEAAKAARSAFEGSTLAMVQGLTDTPEQAFARQRDELLWLKPKR